MRGDLEAAIDGPKRRALRRSIPSPPGSSAEHGDCMMRTLRELTSEATPHLVEDGNDEWFCGRSAALEARAPTDECEAWRRIREQGDA